MSDADSDKFDPDSEDTESLVRNWAHKHLPDLLHELPELQSVILVPVYRRELLRELCYWFDEKGPVQLGARPATIGTVAGGLEQLHTTLYLLTSGLLSAIASQLEVIERLEGSTRAQEVQAAAVPDTAGEEAPPDQGS